ncbi:MAG: hypothetical protein N2Z58_05910 [Fervidobacterium sp.]|nr:hypothetical protein [Fervidobacterium sp.]
MGFIVWISAFSSLLLDNVFREYFTLTPLYFLLESVYNEKLQWKIARIFLFSLLYQSFSYQELNFLWFIITFSVIMIELYRDAFYYSWSASLLQSLIFVLPYYLNVPLSFVYGFVVDCLLFAYVYRKLDLGGA